MRLLNREESLELDHLALSEYQLSIESLINKAANSLLIKIENICDFQNDKFFIDNKEYKQIYFLLGPGNNGQDGLYLSHLIKEKYPNIKIFIYNYSDIFNFLSTEIQQQVLLVDAIFGVGLNKELSTELKNVINKINSNKKYFKVIAVDIPTGLDSNTGNDFGAIIKADYTLACEYPKLGCFLNQGPYFSGKISKVKIGFPKNLINKVVTSYRLIQRKEAQKIFPRKSFAGNKTKYGHLLIVAGSEKMPGALRLASEAAARAGVGYITLALDKEWLRDGKNLKILFPDFILTSKEEILASQNSDLQKKYSAFLVGPGLDEKLNNKIILEKLLSLKKKTLIDAEGINLVAKHQLELHSECILTPHAGELSRLLGSSSVSIEQDRIKACQIFYNKFSANLLLKGHKTIILSQRKYFVIASGNKSLAKAGTGDVLSGIIASFMAQGLDPAKAACLGAFIHGDLADYWVKAGNSISALMASDLLEGIKKYSLNQQK